MRKTSISGNGVTITITADGTQELTTLETEKLLDDLADSAAKSIAGHPYLWIALTRIRRTNVSK